MSAVRHTLTHGTVLRSFPPLRNSNNCAFTIQLLAAKKQTYRSINAREDEVELAKIEAVGVGIHAMIVVNKLALGMFIQRDLQGDTGVEIRYLEGSMNSVLN